MIYKKIHSQSIVTPCHHAAEHEFNVWEIKIRREPSCLTVRFSLIACIQTEQFADYTMIQCDSLVFAVNHQTKRCYGISWNYIQIMWQFSSILHVSFGHHKKIPSKWTLPSLSIMYHRWYNFEKKRKSLISCSGLFFNCKSMERFGWIAQDNPCSWCT